jgi:hypothetical protein
MCAEGIPAGQMCRWANGKLEMRRFDNFNPFIRNVQSIRIKIISRFEILSI